MTGRGAHGDATLQWQAYVPNCSGGCEVRQALRVIRLPVGPVATEAGIKHHSVLAKLGLVPLEALSAAKEAAVVKHVLRGRVQRPVVALARIPRLPRDLDEAIVEGEVVSDGVLPGGELFSVVGELVADEVADAAQRQLLLRALQDGHGDEGDVGVRRLHRPARSLPGRRSACAKAALTFRLRGVKLRTGFCRGSSVRSASASVQPRMDRLFFA